MFEDDQHYDSDRFVIWDYLKFDPIFNLSALKSPPIKFKSITWQDSLKLIYVHEWHDNSK